MTGSIVLGYEVLTMTSREIAELTGKVIVTAKGLAKLAEVAV